jgi:hypothetical protein
MPETIKFVDYDEMIEYINNNPDRLTGKIICKGLKNDKPLQYFVDADWNLNVYIIPEKTDATIKELDAPLVPLEDEISDNYYSGMSWYISQYKYEHREMYTLHKFEIIL